MGVRLGFDFTLLQADRLACYHFRDAGRRRKRPGSETKYFITHGTGSSVNTIICICPRSLKVPWGQHRGPTWHLHMQWAAIQGETPTLGNLLFYSKQQA